MIIIIEYIYENKILLIIISLLLLVIIYDFFNPNIKIEKEEIIKECEVNNDNEEIIKVEIKGAVLNPGVYEVKKGSRIIDLINLAGNLTDNANTDYINLSQTLADEMVIKIFTNEELINYKKVEVVYEYIPLECECADVLNQTCEQEETNKININTASKDDLMTLSGIGESKAISIIDYRTKNGNFKKIEDIMNVSGIGESAFEKIKEDITI